MLSVNYIGWPDIKTETDHVPEILCFINLYDVLISIFMYFNTT